MSLKDEIESAGPWFQNVVFPCGTESAPDREHPREAWRVALPMFGGLAGKSVLDIGCNGGFMTLELERMGASVTAFDCQSRHVRQTSLVKREFDLKCGVMQADIEKVKEHPSLSQAEFDVVLMMGVIYHTENPILALSNALEMCKEYLILESEFIDSQESFAQFMRLDDTSQPTGWMWVPTAVALRRIVNYCGGGILAEVDRGLRKTMKIAPRAHPTWRGRRSSGETW